MTAFTVKRSLSLRGSGLSDDEAISARQQAPRQEDRTNAQRLRHPHLYLGSSLVSIRSRLHPHLGHALIHGDSSALSRCGSKLCRSQGNSPHWKQKSTPLSCQQAARDPAAGPETLVRIGRQPNAQLGSSGHVAPPPPQPPKGGVVGSSRAGESTGKALGVDPEVAQQALKLAQPACRPAMSPSLPKAKSFTWRRTGRKRSGAEDCRSCSRNHPSLELLTAWRPMLALGTGNTWRQDKAVRRARDA